MAVLAAASVAPDLELDLLLEALFQRHGYDFRGHERAMLRRVLHGAMRRRGLRSLSALQDHVLHEPGAAGAVLRALHVPPAAPFDDTLESRALRKLAGIGLRGTALPKVWLADCAGIGQAWATAVLLDEAGLLARTELHCTVASDALLDDCRRASLDAAEMSRYQDYYQRGGGGGQLAAHFDIGGGRAVLAPRLRSRIVWSQYNLVTDASFNEFDLIVCRRALPDFGPRLRRRVLDLFHASLAPHGVLGLDRPPGDGDALAPAYQPLLPPEPWYRRTA